MQSVKLPVETVNKILNFMATLAYSQVADLIAEVQTQVVLLDDDVAEEPNPTESEES